jgi:hypothetical protein
MDEASACRIVAGAGAATPVTRAKGDSPMRQWYAVLIGVALLAAAGLGPTGSVYAQSKQKIVPANTLTLLPSEQVTVPLTLEEGPTITGTLENPALDVQGSVKPGPAPVITHAPTVQDEQQREAEQAALAAERAALIGKEITTCLNPQAAPTVGNQISVPYNLTEGECQGPTVTSAFFP